MFGRKRSRGVVVLFVAVLAVGTSGCAWVTTVSVDRAGDPGNGRSDTPALSDDGRFVAFASDASNLVAGDTNGVRDVFVRDRKMGRTTRVSVDSAGNQGNGPSGRPSISDDGRYVAFSSNAPLVAGDDTNSDVFVHDHTTGATTRESDFLPERNGGRGGSAGPLISGDGRYVVFTANANSNGQYDSGSALYLWLHNRQTSANVLLSSVNLADANFGGYSISDDGRYVAYSDGHLVAIPEDPANPDEGVDYRPRNFVFVHDRQTGQRIPLNGDDHLDRFGTTSSLSPQISGDGRYVAFWSADGSRLVVNDWNLFLHDRQTQITTQVFDGEVEDPQAFAWPGPLAISDNGRYLTFSGLEDGRRESWLYDLQNGSTSSVQAAGAISGLGRYLAVGTAGGQVAVRYAVVPTVGAVTPGDVAPGTTTTVTIIGAGFHPDATVMLGPGVTVGSVSVVDESHLSAQITIAADAARGPCDIQVTNVGAFGPTSGSTNFCFGCFTVT